jgi:3-oxoacyl-[acyl-carrier-protein] synthase III
VGHRGRSPANRGRDVAGAMVPGILGEGRARGRSAVTRGETLPEALPFSGHRTRETLLLPNFDKVTDPTRTARISGTGSFLPPYAQDNHELFAMESIRRAFDVERARGSLRDVPDAADLSPGEVFDRWARQVTGIRERRITRPGDGLTTEEMCGRAAREALGSAGIEPADLDLIVVATVSPSDTVPNAACTVARLLGVPHVGGFALNGACTGFVHALSSAYAFIRSGVADTVLAVSGDTLTRITDFDDPTTAVLFSDGASAAVLTPSRKEGFVGPPLLSAEYAREHLYLVGQGWETAEEPDPKLRMGGGPRVLRRAILAMEDAASRALAAAGTGWDEVDLVIPHQANLRITRGLEAHLDLPRGRVIHTIERYGNCSAATVGIALDETVRGKHGPLPRPARVVLTAVGGGYTTAAAVVDLDLSS